MRFSWTTTDPQMLEERIESAPSGTTELFAWFGYYGLPTNTRLRSSDSSSGSTSRT